MLRTLLHKTLLTAIAILLGGWAVVAQQYVEKGSSLNFKVDEVANYEYNWSVTYTTTGSEEELTSKTFESGDYVFSEEGTYEVTVYPKDSTTLCYGDALSMTVIVSGDSPTAVFEDLDVPYICSANNGSDEGGILTLTVLYSGPKPWTFKYSVDDSPAETPDGADEINEDSFEFDVEIVNTSSKTSRAEIVLVDAQTVSGIAVEEDADNQTLEVDVMALPGTEFGDYTAVIQAGTIQSYTATILKIEDYDLFIPSGATIANETTTQSSDNYSSELSFDLQWGNTPGDYQIKLIERTAFGCVGDTVYANITVVESFVVTLGSDLTICEGETVELTPSIDFDGTYTYLWSDGTTESTLSVFETGTYSVTATDTDTGKTSSTSIEITVVNAPVVDLGEDYTLAEGETKTLDAENEGLSYLWSTDETGQTIVVSTSDEYSVAVTNSYGCIGRDTIVVSSINDVFAIDLGADEDICAGDELVLNPNPTISQNYTYLWSNGAGTSTLTVIESGTYSVTVMDEDGNSKTDEIIVTVHALPIVDLGDDITLYDGETASLDAGDDGTGGSYEWNTGEDTQTITVSEENVYSVMVVDEFGCSSTDEISVIMKEGHSFTVDLGDDIEICEGDQVYLTPTVDRTFTSDPTYLWSPSGSTESGILVDESGSYCVTVTDPYGNVEEDCVDLTVNPTPIVDLGEDLTLQSGETVTLDAENTGSVYIWSTDDITQSITVETTGEYWVEVINSESCTGRDTINITYTSSSQYVVDLPTAFSPNNDSNNDVLYLRGDVDEIKEMTVIIYNRLGHRVFQSVRMTSETEGWDGTYKGEKQDMDVYVYFLSITFTDGSSMKKQGNITLLR
ncbi:gliding motility-associated C-terminal domain-containing protein [Labilibaculum sp.]|uniref:T9SS type B sorting domain-containing protein n=1 Tax=Labilibaculum sp. TaxID=2060723 RepID=UPI003563AFCA